MLNLVKLIAFLLLFYVDVAHGFIFGFMAKLKKIKKNMQK